MKKIPTFLLLLAAALFLNLNANAQQSATSGSVALSINLSDAISIDVVDPTVAFTYATAASYETSQEVSKPGHLIVTSNRAYNISVKASNEFTVVNGTVPLSVVTITVDGSTLNGGASTPATLSLTDQPLLGGATAAVNASFDVEYAIPSATAFIGVNGQQLSTSVTYTATQI